MHVTTQLIRLATSNRLARILRIISTQSVRGIVLLRNGIKQHAIRGALGIGQGRLFHRIFPFTVRRHASYGNVPRRAINLLRRLTCHIRQATRLGCSQIVRDPFRFRAIIRTIRGQVRQGRIPICWFGHEVICVIRHFRKGFFSVFSWRPSALFMDVQDGASNVLRRDNDQFPILRFMRRQALRLAHGLRRLIMNERGRRITILRTSIILGLPLRGMLVRIRANGHLTTTNRLRIARTASITRAAYRMRHVRRHQRQQRQVHAQHRRFPRRIRLSNASVSRYRLSIVTQVHVGLSRFLLRRLTYLLGHRIIRMRQARISSIRVTIKQGFRPRNVLTDTPRISGRLIAQPRAMIFQDHRTRIELRDRLFGIRSVPSRRVILTNGRHHRITTFLRNLLRIFQPRTLIRIYQAYLRRFQDVLFHANHDDFPNP